MQMVVRQQWVRGDLTENSNADRGDDALQQCDDDRI